MKERIFLVLLLLLPTFVHINGLSNSTVQGTFYDATSDVFMVNPYVAPNNYTDYAGANFLDIMSASFVIDPVAWQVTFNTTYKDVPVMNTSTWYFMQVSYKPSGGNYNEIQFNLEVREGKPLAYLMTFALNGSQSTTEVSITYEVSSTTLSLSSVFPQIKDFALNPLRGSLLVRSMTEFDLDLNASSEVLRDESYFESDGIIDAGLTISPHFDISFQDPVSDVFKVNRYTAPDTTTDFDGADMLDIVSAALQYDSTEWAFGVNGTFLDNIVVNESITYSFSFAILPNSGNYQEIAFDFGFSSNRVSFIMSVFATNGSQISMPAVGNYMVNDKTLSMEAKFPKLADFSLPYNLNDIDGTLVFSAESHLQTVLDTPSDSIEDNLLFYIIETNGTATAVTSLPTTSPTSSGLSISLFSALLAIPVLALKKKKKVN